MGFFKDKILSIFKSGSTTTQTFVDLDESILGAGEAYASDDCGCGSGCCNTGSYKCDGTKTTAQVGDYSFSRHSEFFVIPPGKREVIITAADITALKISINGADAVEADGMAADNALVFAQEYDQIDNVIYKTPTIAIVFVTETNVNVSCLN